MKGLLLIITLLSSLSFATLPKTNYSVNDVSDQKSYEDGVYCERFKDSRVRGYSIYRNYDDNDIGNSIWTLDKQEQCHMAARISNRVKEGIVCAPYFNRRAQRNQFSIYRIVDGKDLGTSTFTDFRLCLQAVAKAFDGIFCAPFKAKDSTASRWSMYDVFSGNDVGRNHYNSFETCANNI